LEIINRHAEELSREALDVLKYQTILEISPAVAN
jgi:hypothetical protein